MVHSEHGSQGFYSQLSTPDEQLMGGGISGPFLKTEKKCLILQKRALILEKRCPVSVHRSVKFLFKMQF